MTLLARAIREKTSPERVLVLQDDLAPLSVAAMQVAGWTLDSTEYVYETNLLPRRHGLHAGVLEGGMALLADPRVQPLLQALGRNALDLQKHYREDWTFVALLEKDVLVALGSYGTAKPGYGGTDMIGVHPTRRGQGFGTRLHAHMLSRLTARHARHGGITSADNVAMQQIFHRNGSQRVAVQMYFRPA
ncbi:GNAT family N-acetyltransferase (plasmid) [Deinococcus taeanensis]|uniref:GNAT family N-acetyltransferase n=1 Tax=Deinococcus taeanensis TaxID=2737050 RepID=UPI001CDB8EBA|nr:GNAT family N-acetyltransferase [Deinococcus taeanensis]UBV45079.1 GNAT family N-acetyltransferase [Deinococcus taeanensis]